MLLLKRSLKDIYTLHSLVIYRMTCIYNGLLLHINMCVYIYMYILKYIYICIYTYECTERDFQHTFTVIKIMIIEKLRRIGCKPQAVILLSYFSSVTTHFVYVVSKWHHPARLKMSPDLSSTPP